MAEQYSQGEVICDRVPWSRSISCFVDKQIQQWLSSHRDQNKAAPAAHYQVVFERVTLGHRLGCHVELEMGSELWRGSNYGQGLHQSLIQTLDHMVPIQRRAPPGPSHLTQS